MSRCPNTSWLHAFHMLSVSLDGNWLGRYAVERPADITYYYPHLPDSYWTETKQILRISWSLVGWRRIG